MSIQRYISERSKRWHRPLTLTRSPCTTQESYQPKTLTKANGTRRLFLPHYPHRPDQDQSMCPLLLPNVPGHLLTSHESARRLPGAYDDPFNPKTILSEKIASFCLIMFEENFGALCNRLNLDRAIIDFNLSHLKDNIDTFMSKYRAYARCYLLDNGRNLQPEHLKLPNKSEMCLALEFFLAMDVDMFYMKSCAFCGTQPRPSISHSFFEEEKPSPVYSLLPCNRPSCVCRSSMLSDETSAVGASLVPMRFSDAGHSHRFINGYEVLLNCPATCATSNVIYALTCVCNEFDYVGSTALDLNEAVLDHRQHGNRIMLEVLLWGHAQHTCPDDADQKDKQMANKMRLYQHITRCPIAMQLVLDANPDFWCFVPMANDQAMIDDLDFLSMEAPTVPETGQSSITMFVGNKGKGACYQPDNANAIDQFIRLVSTPLNGYSFTHRQREQQRLLLQRMLDRSFHWTRKCDLFEATIIAVLPENTTAMFRCFIESLFATHAESKLNLMNLLSSDTNQWYGPPYRLDIYWCQPLVRRPIPSASCEA